MFITFTLPIYLFWLVLLAAVLALVTHLLFLRSLAVNQPELWREYRRIAFTSAHWSAKRPVMVRQVYTRINVAAVVAARRREVFAWHIFAAVLVLVSFSFGITRMLGS